MWDDDEVQVDPDLLEEWEEEALQDAADIDKLLEDFNYTGSRHHY